MDDKIKLKQTKNRLNLAYEVSDEMLEMGQRKITHLPSAQLLGLAQCRPNANEDWSWVGAAICPARAPKHVNSFPKVRFGLKADIATV